MHGHKAQGLVRLAGVPVLRAENVEPSLLFLTGNDALILQVALSSQGKSSGIRL
jgi:hypothetical protein